MTVAGTIPPLTPTPEDPAYRDRGLRSSHQTVQQVARTRFLRDDTAGDSYPAEAVWADGSPDRPVREKSLALGPRTGLEGGPSSLFP